MAATSPKRTLKSLIPWFYVTRAIGAAMLVYGVAFDETGERGTIILTGAGFLGVDKVARSDTAK